MRAALDKGRVEGRVDEYGGVHRCRFGTGCGSRALTCRKRWQLLFEEGAGPSMVRSVRERKACFYEYDFY